MYRGFFIYFYLMNEYVKSFELRWADVDANFHVSHSKYYELGAHCRMSFLIDCGMTTELMKELKTGPILFREECIFRKEIHASEMVYVNMMLSKCKRNGSRWSARHELKKANGTIAAIINADLAWIDLDKRKLATPALAASVIEQLPKTHDFVYLD